MRALLFCCLASLALEGCPVAIVGVELAAVATRAGIDADRHEKSKPACQRMLERKRRWAHAICRERDSCACRCARAGKLGSRIDEAATCRCHETECFPEIAAWCLEDEAGCRARLADYLLEQP